MIRQLPPWFENLGKRAVKAPKVYFRDSGILHALLGLRTKKEIPSHPRLGFIWEGYALEEIIRMAKAEREAYFYKTHAGAELDLLLTRKGEPPLHPVDLRLFSRQECKLMEPWGPFLT